MRPRGLPLAAAAGLAVGLAASIANDVRLARSAQPLTDSWQHRQVVRRGASLLGISFRPRQAEAMQLEPRESLRTLLAYPFDVLRLGAYWNRIELQPDRFAFDELDWQIESAARAGRRLIVCVGAVKTFGHPEFFVPAHRLVSPLREGSLVEPTNHASLLSAATEFVERVVERYRDQRAIVAWQVEHESVDTLGFEHSWRLSLGFVAAEVGAVRRADPDRPILLNGFVPTSLLGGATQWWRTRGQGDSLQAAIQLADIVGLDFYPRIGLLALGPMSLYLDGSRRAWTRRALGRVLAAANLAGCQVMVSEGQAEPWETVVNPPNPHSAVTFSCTPEALIDNYNLCMTWPGLPPGGLYAYLFWGAEYWLMRARHGDASYLRAFARVLDAANG